MSPPLLLFAPGAGAGTEHPWMQRWAARLAPLGRVVPFDYDYRREGRKAPDRLPKLLAAHTRALEEAQAGHDGPVVLVGKSMGSRVGCVLSATLPVDALICFGYPLVSGGKTKTLRDGPLRDLRAPTLFVQGTRDPMGPLERFEALLPELSCPTQLCIVEGGNHSLVVGKRALAASGRTQDSVEEQIMVSVSAFLKGAVSPGNRP